MTNHVSANTFTSEAKNKSPWKFFNSYCSGDAGQHE